MADEQGKRQAFDRCVRALIKQSRDTIHARYRPSNISPDEVVMLRPEEAYLNRYERIYAKTKPEEHAVYFETLYNKHKRSILATLRPGYKEDFPEFSDIDDKWLIVGDLVIQYGSGTAAAASCGDIRIMLSEIYKIACDLQTTANNTYQGMGLAPAEWPQDLNLIRPHIILLHLMRIFYYLIDTKDKKDIGKIVSFLEDLLGMTTRTVPDALRGNSETNPEYPEYRVQYWLRSIRWSAGYGFRGHEEHGLSLTS